IANHNFSARKRRPRGNECRVTPVTHDLSPLFVDGSFQRGNLSCTKDQRQFVRETLFLSNDGFSVLLFFGSVHQLDRLPVRDVAYLTVTEDAVQHTGRAEQTNVTAMERCE